MNIGIDARTLTAKKSGLGYYLNDLLINILAKDTKNIYYLFSDREIFFDNKNFQNVRLITDTNSFFFKKTLWYTFKIKKLVKEYKIDLFWGTQNVLPILGDNVKAVLTLHDLIIYKHPETMNFHTKLIYGLLIPYSVKRANLIIAVSNSTKDDILEKFNIDDTKIKVIYEDIIVNNEISLNSDLLSEIGIEKGKYLLSIGNIEPRKNLILLLNAFNKIKKETDLKLVICGNIGWKSEEFKKKIHDGEYGKDVYYLNYVSQEDKITLLKNCFAFVFPSIYEGFGLPVIETIKNDKICIVSNRSSLKELIEIDELKFEYNSEDDLKQTVIRVYKDDNIYNKCLVYCRKRALDFDWGKFSNEYIKEFEALFK